jgi:diguanylate cyclase (GGDEF)-like protein
MKDITYAKFYNVSESTLNSFILSFLFCLSFLFYSSISFANDKIVLQLKSEHGFQFAGFYAAQLENYYKNDNLDVTIVPFDSTENQSDSSIDQVINNKAQFGIGNLDILLKKDQGHDLLILSPIFQKSATVFYSLKQKQINSIYDLKDMTIAVDKGGFVHFEVLSLFKFHGFDAKQINFKFISPSLDNLLNGTVDVIATYGVSGDYDNRYISEQLNRINTDKFSGDFYGDVLYTSRKIYNKNPKMVNDFVKASIKGWNYAVNNKPSLIQQIVKNYTNPKMSSEEFFEYNNSFANIIEDFLQWPDIDIGHSNTIRWFNTYNQLKSSGIIKGDWSMNELLVEADAYNYNKTKVYLIVILIATLIIIQLYYFNKIKDFRIYYFTSVLVLASLLYMAEVFLYNKNKQSLEVKSLQQLNTIRAKLIEIINTNLSSLKGLAAYISVNPEITQEQFIAYSEQIYQKHNAIINFAAAPDLVVTMVYPLLGNEGVLGLDYNQNKPQKELANKAKDSGNIVIAGPLKLVQGGDAIIARTSVTLNDTNPPKFWGIVSLPLDLQKILSYSGVYDSSLSINLAIRGKDGLGNNGDVFYGDPQIFEDLNALNVEVYVGDGLWNLVAQPKQGWEMPPEWSWSLRLLMGLILSFIFYLLFLKQEQRNKSRSYEKKIEDNRKLLHEVGELALIGGWKVDSTGNLLQWTAEKDSPLGASFPNNMNTLDDILKVFDISQRIQNQDFFINAIKKGLAFDFETFFKKKNGRKVWFRIASDEFIKKENGYEVSGAIQNISDYKEIYQILNQQAKYDSLTKLLNRSEFIKQLNFAIEQARIETIKIAILFIDIDDFKNINDNLGHSLGDESLKHVSKVIKSCFTKKHPISRFSGDEFITYIKYTNHDYLLSNINSILEKISQPFMVSNTRIFISCSIGIGLFPEHASTSEELIGKADLAMYKVKHNGKNNYSFYSDELSVVAEKKHKLKNKLLHAFRSNELMVYYQPIVNLQTHKICKLEALIRWIDKEDFQYNTEEFIKIAEESGLINEIDMFVLESSLSTIYYLNATSNNNIDLSFNVSPSLFINAGKTLDDWISKIIEIRKFIGVTVEITEHSLIQNPENTKKILNQLKAHDINIAIDDFGVGYSSLNYLTQFPIDQIKIDKSFISRIGQNDKSDLMVEILLHLAQQLNIKVVAEGIENEMQLNFIKNRNCEFGQGYFFSKAHSIEYLVDKLKLNY